MPSWTSRSGGRIARRNIHIPDWESWIRARYRGRNAAFRIAFPIRCMPLIASPPKWDMRSPDTKSARSDSSAVRKSGKRSAGYVRSASRAAMYVPRASWKPVLYARPYPRRGSGITRAPFAVAISRVRSRESVSTTRISNKRGPSAFRTSDRKSTRLNSSHLVISYAVFCLKKKNLDQAMPQGRDPATITSGAGETARLGRAAAVSPSVLVDDGDYSGAALVWHSVLIVLELA